MTVLNQRLSKPATSAPTHQVFGFLKVVGAIALASSACGKLSDSDDERNTGGRVATGGQDADTGGKHASGGVESGGRSSDGGRPRGGAPPTGGALPTGGTSSIGGGGIGGDGIDSGGGGAGGVSGIDPACSCKVDDFYGDCTLPIEEFRRRVPSPRDCELDSDRTFSRCEDGTTRDVWLVGGENEYELVFDAEGNLVYGRASGYVGDLCNANRQELGALELADIHAGALVPASSCETCVVCASGNAGGSGGAPPLCD